MDVQRQAFVHGGTTGRVQAAFCSAAISSLAKEKHCPQRGLRPKLRYALVGQEAPSRAALRTSHSRIALQTQTIMVIGLADNETKSQ